jgi:response regulator RpfG family c-di-GMP phosphodiesterase
LKEENKRPSISKLLFRLAALSDLGIEVTSDKDFKGIMKSSLYLALGTLSVSKGGIFQFDSDRCELNAVAHKGLDDVDGMTLKLEKEELGDLIKKNDIIKMENVNGVAARFFVREKSNLEKIKSYILVPLVVKESLVGILFLDRKFFGGEYSKDDFDILSVMARHIAVSIHNHHLLSSLSHKMQENKRLYEELRLIYYDTIQAFAAAIDAKDAYTKGHSSRVSKYCVAISKEMGLTKEEIEGMKVAGFLHDIGKIAVDKDIINKPAVLSRQERLELDQHPVISYEILSRMRFPWKDISINVRYHHEKIDGSGYPDHLKGEEIPVGAKIMALADAFDAMTTDRPYRKRLTLEDTIIEVGNTLGKHFDAEVCRCLFKMIKSDISRNGNSSKILAGLGDIPNIEKIDKLLAGMV